MKATQHAVTGTTNRSGRDIDVRQCADLLVIEVAKAVCLPRVAPDGTTKRSFGQFGPFTISVRHPKGIPMTAEIVRTTPFWWLGGATYRACSLSRWWALCMAKE